MSKLQKAQIASAMSSVQACRQTPAKRDKPAPAPTHATTRPLCPECMAAFDRKHPNQLFCTVAHRDAWNNRASVRGRVLTPLAMVSRVTRFGGRGDAHTGKRASHEAHTLMQRWIEEDREAGRMPQPEYLRRRYSIGFEPLAK